MNIGGNLLENIKKIGIVGTNGKTTTARLIMHLLDRQGFRVKYFESSGQSAQRGGSIERFKKHVNAKGEDFQVALMELKPSDIELDFGFELDAVIHTNFDTRHMGERFQYKQKNQLREAFHRVSKNGTIIINIDDPFHMQLLYRIENILVIPYGFSSKATMTASSIETSHSVKFTCCLQRGMTNQNDIEIEPMEFPIHVRLMGRHNIQNTLAAITLALMFGVSPENVTMALSDFPQLERRMNTIYDNHIKIIDDSSRNPLSYEAVFDTVLGIDYENLHIVNGISDKDPAWHNSNALTISNWLGGVKCMNLITTCCTDTIKTDQQTVKYNKDEFHRSLQQYGISFQHYDKLCEAVEEVLAKAQKNDLILLLGESGMVEAPKIISQNFMKEKF